MVYAAKIIKDLGLEDDYTLVITGTVQEEDCFLRLVNDQLRKTVKILGGMFPDEGAVIAFVLNHVCYRGQFDHLASELLGRRPKVHFSVNDFLRAFQEFGLLLSVRRQTRQVDKRKGAGQTRGNRGCPARADRPILTVIVNSRKKINEKLSKIKAIFPDFTTRPPPSSQAVSERYSREIPLSAD